MYIKTEAIVLRKVFYNDSDAILTLFSRKLGKISVYARGARKPRTMISSVAHPFIYGEFILRGKPHPAYNKYERRVFTDLRFRMQSGNSKSG